MAECRIFGWIQDPRFSATVWRHLGSKNSPNKAECRIFQLPFWTLTCWVSIVFELLRLAVIIFRRGSAASQVYLSLSH